MAHPSNSVLSESSELMDTALQLAELSLLPPWRSPEVHVERRIRALRARRNVASRLVPGPAFALHLIPTRELEIELEPLLQMPVLFNGTTRDTRIVHDGYLGTSPAPRSAAGMLRGYTHLRRDGVLESVETRLLATRMDAAGGIMGMPARGFDHALAAALTSLSDLVRVHFADVEFTAFVSILDAGERWFEVSNGWSDSERLLDDRILLPSVHLGGDVPSVAERLSQFIWQAVGYARSPYAAER